MAPVPHTSLAKRIPLADPFADPRTQPIRGTPGVVGLGHVVGVGIHDDQPAHPLGMGGGIADRGRTAMVRSDQHHPLTPGGVKHRGQISVCGLLDEPLERVATRSADASRLTPHRAAEAAETLREANEARRIPQQVDREDQRRAPHQIQGPVTRHLIREAHPVRRLRVLRDWPILHANPLPDASLPQHPNGCLPAGRSRLASTHGFARQVRSPRAIDLGSGATRATWSLGTQEPSGPLRRRQDVDCVVDEHEPHRPVPRSRLG